MDKDMIAALLAVGVLALAYMQARQNGQQQTEASPHDQKLGKGSGYA